MAKKTNMLADADKKGPGCGQIDSLSLVRAVTARPAGDRPHTMSAKLPAMVSDRFACAAIPLFPALIAQARRFHGRPSGAGGFARRWSDVFRPARSGKGGGWLRVSTRKRLAAVTNVRVGRLPKRWRASRGELVTGTCRETGAGTRMVAETAVNSSIQFAGMETARATVRPATIRVPIANCRARLHRLANAAPMCWAESASCAKRLAANWLAR